MIMLNGKIYENVIEVHITYDNGYIIYLDKTNNSFKEIKLRFNFVKDDFKIV